MPALDGFYLSRKVVINHAISSSSYNLHQPRVD